MNLWQVWKNYQKLTDSEKDTVKIVLFVGSILFCALICSILI